jgi:predicted ATPase
MAALISCLRGTRMLLVLDNVEQVVDAATDVARLLGSVSLAKVLVTSLMRLHIYGERVFSVPSLCSLTGRVHPTQCLR